MPFLDSIFDKFQSLSPRNQALIKNSLGILVVMIIISSIYDHQVAEQRGEAKELTFSDIAMFPVTSTFKFFQRIFSWIFNFLYGLFTRFGVASEDFNRFIKSTGGIFVFLFKQIAEFFMSIFEFIETVLTAPIQILLNFSQFVEKFLEKFSQIFIVLYQLLMAILKPLWQLIKWAFFQSLNLLKLPLKLLRNIGNLLKDLSASILNATAKTAKVVINGLIAAIRKLSHLSFSVIFDVIRIPFDTIWRFLKYLYERFSILEFLKQVVYFISRIPHYLYTAVVDVSNFIYRLIRNLFVFIVDMGGSMLEDIVEALKITKYLPEFLHPVVNFLYQIGKALVDLFVQIIVLPYHFVVYILKLLRHPFQTLIDTFYYMFDLIRSLFNVIAEFFRSRFFQIILNILSAPYNALKKIVQSISMTVIADIIKFPLRIFQYFWKGIKYLLVGIVNFMTSFAKSIGRGLINILSFLKHFSFQKLLYYLLSPIRFILRVIDDLCKIPIAGYIVRAIRTIIYIPLWLISFFFRFIYFFLESFYSFLTRNFTLKNVFDMWDNVCWPKEAEFCQKILAEKEAKDKVLINQNFDYDRYNYEVYQN